ncbi:shikimate kinase [Congregibacter sp.]|uniref:shikimate kinase n=1 Tax=Congregibacter sp. TaxID=2744308 RepID=UPI003F6CF57C
MSRIVVFGNSGSGKSTLALAMSADAGLAHLDLDTLAWEPTTPPERKALAASEAEILRFTESHPDWIIEGCYADLIALVLPLADELIFLDLSTEDCISHARARPWEPHKYESKEAQDANLEMLISWIRDYPTRDDSCSRPAHRALFDAFTGKKTRVTDPQSNPKSD